MRDKLAEWKERLQAAEQEVASLQEAIAREEERLRLEGERYEQELFTISRAELRRAKLLHSMRHFDDQNCPLCVLIKKAGSLT